MADAYYFTAGRFEVDDAPTQPDHVRVDVGGCVSGKGCWPDRDRESRGGLVEIRLTSRRAIRFTLWTELAHDIAQAANAAIWRRVESRLPRCTGGTDA